jgi:molybdate transport system substrate-binding protein
MNRRRTIAFIGGIIATLCLTVGWQLLTYSTAIAQTNTTLLVSAAASLKDALTELKPIFEKERSKIAVNYNFGASGALQQQIEQGAPADIFFSAAKKQMDALESKGYILPETRRDLLTNSLVLVVPPKSQLKITDLKQLTDGNVQRIAVGEPKSVPVGQYTEQVFQKLQILERVKPKLVLGNNVRNVLAAVGSGNADAGFVYITDAKTSKQVKVALTVAENLHSPIVYPIAVLKASKNAGAAKQFMQFLGEKQAQATFEKYGFGIAKK